MKAIVSALLVSCALAAPFSAFAQSGGNDGAALSRTQVRADLVRVEQAGYQPSGSQANYPANIERAEAICLEYARIGRRVLAVEQQHRKALAASEEIAAEGAE